jgi:hypothetical protein
MAIYFAEEFDKHVMPYEERFHIGVEFDLSARAATGRNMFGSGTRPQVRGRRSPSLQAPTAPIFRLNNLAAIPGSIVRTILSEIARKTIWWK